MPMDLCIIWSCFYAMMAELPGCEETIQSTNPKIFTVQAFAEKDSLTTSLGDHFGKVPWDQIW